MSNANKEKGKTYERSVAKHLSRVFGLNFERVPNSGAFIGGKNIVRGNKLTKEQIDMFEGDIITPVELDHLRLECKWHKDISWPQFFSPSGEAKLNGWIDQSSQGTRPFWFLLFKINRAGEYIVFPSSMARILKMPESWLFYHPIDTPGYVVVKMDGFFEMNTERILALKEC